MSNVKFSEVYDSTETYIYSMCSHSDGYVYAGSGTNGKIYRSNDGTTWTEVYDSTETYIFSMCSHSDNYVYIGTYPSGKIFRSNDGTTWTEVYDSTESYILSLCSHSDGYVYAGSGTNGKIFRSNDGTTWTEVYDSSETRIYSLCSHSDGYVYAGTDPSGKIFRSNDGTTWSEVYDSTESYILSLCSHSDGYVYAGTTPSGKIYRSNNGVTWSEVYDSTESYILSLCSHSDGYVYAGSGDNAIIYKSSTYTLDTFPKLKKNSLSTTIASPGINDTDTVIPVTDLSVFFNSDSELISKSIVIGYDNTTETYAEEITITEATGITGPGNLIGATRGVNADGTNGAAKAHISGTSIAVMFSTGIYELLRANDIDINSALLSKATKTTATQSIYVDKAATGAGDGTSWTDAFTTIQAAINNLPTVLEHDVTIIVRKGTTAYDEAVTLDQCVCKGSIIIRGEYYWYGACAAAATPSTTKFNLTATDGAQIAAGDPVLVRDGFADYIYSTVVATVDKGSNVWEIEITDALPTGNIGTGDYYTICKTKIVCTTGTAFTGAAIKDFKLYGIYIESSTSNALSLSTSGVTIYGCLFICPSIYSAIVITGYGGIYYTYSSYLYSGATGRVFWNYAAGSYSQLGSGATGATGNVIASGGNSVAGINLQSGAVCYNYGSIFDVQAGTGFLSEFMSIGYIAYSTISPSGRTAATTGLYATPENSAIKKGASITNNAVTPENPASSTSGAYIG